MMYPFLPEAKESVKKLNLNLAKVDEEPLLISAIDSSKKDIASAFTINKTAPPREIAHVSFVLSKVLLSAIGDKYITGKYMSYKLDQFRQSLEREGLPALIKIARDMGVALVTKEGVKISVFDFLRFRPDFMDLASSSLDQGQVTLTKNQLVWVLLKMIEQDISARPQAKDFPEEILKHARELKSSLSPLIEASSPMIRREAQAITALSEYALPPCMKEFIRRLGEGTANHAEHYALATFLNGLKLPEKDILKVFSASPKFKERVTTYQVRFIKAKGYKCPGCASLKKDGLCRWQCSRNTPISVYFYNLRSRRNA